MQEANAEKTSWGQFLAVAAAYAACYEVARYFSFSHWILTAGLRLACLLLVPYRLWPALIFGEALPLMQNSLINEESFGMAWASVSAIPFIPLCMPIVRWARQRMPLYLPNGDINASMILTATLACAAVTAVRTDAAVFAALIVTPDGMAAWTGEALIDFLAYLLGAYLGALTLTPILLALREWCREPASWTAFFRHRLTRDVLLFTAPGLLVVALAASSFSGASLDTWRLLVVLPVVVLTVRHGWQGAAIAGLLSSIALAATCSTLLDPAFIRVQVVLALAISGALLTGVRISHRVSARASMVRRSGL